MMRYHFFSKCSLFSTMMVSILLGLTLSVEARVVNRSVLSENRWVDVWSSTTGNRIRRGGRELRDTDTKGETEAEDDDDTSTTKKSIASRTSSVVPTKKDPSSSMNIRFVKPETAPPSVAPPTPAPTAKKVHSESNPTSTKSGSSESTSKTEKNNKDSDTTPASSPVMAETASTRTSYPSTADIGSIASRTSGTDDSRRAPLSDSMEFEFAKTEPPNTTHYYTNPNPKSGGTNTTEAEDDEDDEDDYIPQNATSTSTQSDDFVSTFNPMDSTSSPKILHFTEHEQPEKWPEFVGGLFIVAGLAFFAATAIKNYRKRKDYEKIPTSLTV